ncbi:MAG: sulfur carrier protein ThiS [Desulfobacterota bacterium]|nr:sulfur carrier protein ThiS [Thermodesulfobacteriota bacterium]
MKIRLNGQERILPNQRQTVGELLTFLGVRPERVAVEVNGEIVSPEHFNSFMVYDGDRVEIVSFVGGG